jgi:putative solute:sodium symporter small subunit
MSRRHHRATNRKTSDLLAKKPTDHFDFVAYLVCCHFCRELFCARSELHFFGWPFSFWMGAQGSLVVYCLIIWFYARYMNKLDVKLASAKTRRNNMAGMTPEEGGMFSSNTTNAAIQKISQ